MTIRKSIRIERPAEIAFKLFCEQIGQWWPKGPSFGNKIATDMISQAWVRRHDEYED